MKRLRIKNALILSFMLFGTVIAGFGLYAINRLEVSNENVRVLATNWLPSVEGIQEMDTALADLRAAYRDHILAIDAASEAKATEEIASEIARLQTATESYQALAVEPEDQQKLAEILSELYEYKAGGDEMLLLSTAKENEKAKVALAAMRPHSVRIAEIINEIVEKNQKGAKDLYTDSVASYDKTFYVTLGVLGLSLALVGGLVYFALVGIARPIEAITRAMLSIAGGDNSAPIPFGGRADEVGEMASAVVIFRKNAVANIDLEKQAVLERGVAEQLRVEMAQTESQRMQQMTEATQGLAHGLKEVADGNLSVELNTPFASDFESLRSNFNAAVSQLGSALRSVSDATGAIDNGSSEISQSTEDLSKRTEQQAAALEETAAALDQITANVTNSSKRAEEARDVAVLANKSANHSGMVVANAVNAMQRIEQSSNQISNIIGVIDEIAFQTNLLALNAGVEAARAGEAGKGFAVVAQEVRELAQRSAQAAKEIKGLIQNSSVEVQSGVKLVSETGSALKTIEDYIITINQHMDSIATSSREQSVGLAEVNTAVNQMDQVTQQNAAMVEETSAASSTLASESQHLRSLLARFRLDQDAAASPASQLRRTAAAMAQPARQERSAAPRAATGNLAVKQWENF